MEQLPGGGEGGEPTVFWSTFISLHNQTKTHLRFIWAEKNEN